MAQRTTSSPNSYQTKLPVCSSLLYAVTCGAAQHVLAHTTGIPGKIKTLKYVSSSVVSYQTGCLGEETMSDNLYATPGSCSTVGSEVDTKESRVNIYVSAESLRVFENPWVEGTTPTIPAPAEDQQPVFLVSENSRSRNRADSVFRVTLCLLLLAGLVAFICLGVKMSRDKRERKQLMKCIHDLKQRRDFLWGKFCGRHPPRRPNEGCIEKGELNNDDEDACEMFKWP